jgi:hypothetical protein
MKGKLIFLSLLIGLPYYCTIKGNEERERENKAFIEKKAVDKARFPCGQTLASYNTDKWHSINFFNASMSKWMEINCARPGVCKTYTGKKSNPHWKTVGDSYHFSRTDDKEDKCDTDLNNFTCKYEVPKFDPNRALEDVNQVLRTIGVPQVSSLKKADYMGIYSFDYDDGHELDVWVMDGECQHISSIGYSHKEYME